MQCWSHIIQAARQLGGSVLVEINFRTENMHNSSWRSCRQWVLAFISATTEVVHEADFASSTICIAGRGKLMHWGKQHQLQYLRALSNEVRSLDGKFAAGSCRQHGALHASDQLVLMSHHELSCRFYQLHKLKEPGHARLTSRFYSIRQSCEWSNPSLLVRWPVFYRC